MLKYHILALLKLLVEQMLWFSSYLSMPMGTYMNDIQIAQVVCGSSMHW